ncbi:MAG: plasmid maintenance protein CcdB [Alphaproteobacteria bacterium]|nr:MAG: plasmid maintenance protein CcdB [Alphaproteobacteria bacterium]
MAKYDVHRLQVGKTMVVDCQTDLLSHLNSRFVVPLMPIDEAPIAGARLNPTFDIGGERYSMVTQFATTMQAAALGVSITSLAAHDLTIGNALDMLISGF